MTLAKICREGGNRNRRDHLHWICTPLATPKPSLWSPLSQGMVPLTHQKFCKPEIFLSKARVGTTNGAETEERAIQGLPYVGIHHVCRHQTRHCLCSQDVLLDTNLLRRFLGKFFQKLTLADIRLRSANLVGELGGKVEEQRGWQHHWKNNICYQDHPVLPVTRQQTQECKGRDL